MTWTVALGGETCGGCGALFPAGEPVALVTPRHLWRCRPCVAVSFPGAGVDWAAVDAAKARHEAQRAGTAGDITKPGRPHAPVLRGFAPVGAIAQTGLHPLLRDVGGFKGVRKPKPFHEAADDPLIARLHEESNR